MSKHRAVVKEGDCARSAHRETNHEAPPGERYLRAGRRTYRSGSLTTAISRGGQWGLRREEWKKNMSLGIRRIVRVSSPGHGRIALALPSILVDLGKICAGMFFKRT